MPNHRIESDALGSVEIPDALYYGVQTHRAVENFDISDRKMDDFTPFIESIAQIKKASALANRDLNRLSQEQCDAICRAADDVIGGAMKGQFPLDIFQGGGGTSTNMNVNEVIGNRANEIITGRKGNSAVHPNTHVNMGQSTNDVIPAAMKMAAFTELSQLEESIQCALETLLEKEALFSDVVKLGRTCLQDALPMTMGQMFSGYRSALQRQLVKIQTIRGQLLHLPLPATAIGTCFGCFPGFEKALYAHLSTLLNTPVHREENLFDGLQNADIWIDVSSALKSLASFFNKLSRDLRLMSSGPRAGLNEITLPAVQPGSSIMPGKINPVMPEMMIQVAFRVFGNDASVSLAADQGELELNVWESLILNGISESINLLARSIPLFTDKCLKGITANKKKCAVDAQSSLALSTVLATLVDYPMASRIAKKAYSEQATIKEVVIEEGLLSEEKATALLDPSNLIDIETFERTLVDQGGLDG